MNQIKKFESEKIDSQNIKIITKQPDALQSSYLVADEFLFDLYKEILNDIRIDRIEVDGLLANFTDMVFNGGDATSSSKEAVVNLVKIKSDILDKKTKMADLLTSLKIKEKNNSKNPTNQTNHIHITDRRAIIEAINDVKNKEKNEYIDI